MTIKNEPIVSKLTGKIGKLDRTHKDKLFVSYDYDYVSVPIPLLDYENLIETSEKVKKELERRIKKYHKKYSSLSN